MVGHDIIADYEIGEVIGQGSYGVVRLARRADSQSDEWPLVAKVLSKKHLLRTRKFSSGPNGKMVITTGLDQCRLEIAILRKIDCFHVIQLIDALEPVGDLLVLIFHRAEGTVSRWSEMRANAFDKPNPGSYPDYLSIPQLRRIFRDSLLGLQYLHAQGVLHRDINPNNILYTGCFREPPYTCPPNLPTGWLEAETLLDSTPDVGLIGRAIISDLGCAMMIADGEDDAIKSSSGTPAFASPESITGQAYPGKASDIWSLGCTFYSLVTGMHPIPLFDPETDLPLHPSAVYDLVRSHTIDFHAVLESPAVLDLPQGPEGLTISASLLDLLQGLLERDPSLRLTATKALVHPFITGDDGHLLEQLAAHANTTVSTSFTEQRPKDGFSTPVRPGSPINMAASSGSFSVPAASSFSSVTSASSMEGPATQSPRRTRNRSDTDVAASRVSVRVSMMSTPLTPLSSSLPVGGHHSALATPPSYQLGGTPLSQTAPAGSPLFPPSGLPPLGPPAASPNPSHARSRVLSFRLMPSDSADARARGYSRNRFPSMLSSLQEKAETPSMVSTPVSASPPGDTAMAPPAGSTPGSASFGRPEYSLSDLSSSAISELAADVAAALEEGEEAATEVELYVRDAEKEAVEEARVRALTRATRAMSVRLKPSDINLPFTQVDIGEKSAARMAARITISVFLTDIIKKRRQAKSTAASLNNSGVIIPGSRQSLSIRPPSTPRAPILSHLVLSPEGRLSSFSSSPEIKGMTPSSTFRSSSGKSMTPTMLPLSQGSNSPALHAQDFNEVEAAWKHSLQMHSRRNIFTASARMAPLTNSLSDESKLSPLNVHASGSTDESNAVSPKPKKSLMKRIATALGRKKE